MIYALIAAIGLLLYELRNRGIKIKRALIYSGGFIILSGLLLSSMFDQTQVSGRWSFLVIRLGAIVGLILAYKKIKQKVYLIGSGLVALSPAFVELVNRLFGGG